MGSGDVLLDVSIAELVSKLIQHCRQLLVAAVG